MKQEDSSPSLEMDIVSGLPSLDGQSIAVMTGQGDVIISQNGKIKKYSLNGRNHKPETLASFRVPVTAVAETASGLIAAAGNALHTLTDRGARELAKLDGEIRSIASAGGSVFAVVGRPGRMEGMLVEVDALNGIIVSERSLRTAAVKLSTDVSGSYLGISDGSQFRTMSLAPSRPCPDREEPEPPRSTAPDPCNCNGDHKEAERPSDQPPGPSRKDKPEPEPCDPGQSGAPLPDGGRVVGDGRGVSQYPPGARTPWDPCRAHLFFEVDHIAAAGKYIIAADRGAHNVAVLHSGDLRILHQAQYRQGAVILSNAAQPLMLVYQNHQKVWERVIYETFQPDAIDTEPLFDPDRMGDSITFTGSPLPVLKGDRAPAMGNKRVLVIPVLDPGQSFNDADLPRLAGYFKREGFDHVQNFYRENSFGMLNTIEFLVHGVHAGKGGPVRLPKPVGEYYNPVYVGAHVDMVKTGITFPNNVVFDGRESMSLNVQPMTGGRPPTTFNVKFFALLSSARFDNYPAQIKYLGTETATIAVRRPNGSTANLTLRFTPKTVDFNNATEAVIKSGVVPPKLIELQDYLDGVIAAAETAAGIPPRLFTKPSMRFLDQGTNGPGLLITTLAHTQTTGPKLEVNTVSTSGGDPLDLKSAFTGRMSVVAGAATPRLQTYLDYVTTLAQEAAGIDHNARRLAQDPVVAVDVGAGKMTSSLFISNEDGGPGATMSISNIVEMGELFSTWNGVPNTNVTAGRSATPKDGNDGFDGLIDEVFTALVDRQAAPGQHQQEKKNIDNFFARFDMVIIGAIFPASVDAANPRFPRPEERWNAGPTSWAGHMRAVEGPRTARFRPLPKEIQFFSQWNLVPFNVPPDYAVMCHELGHAIGLDDLYAREAGYRNDLIYMEDWAIMDSHGSTPHHCGYHKWQAGWIPDSRVLTIERPKEDETLTREVLLVPVEHWHANDTLIGAARAAFNMPQIPVVQLVELALGGDADVFGLIEARQKGGMFSHSLPVEPSVLVTNCIVWWDKTRYAFNGRYRAPVHLLHSSRNRDTGETFHAPLLKAGDTFDLARGRELPVKGIVVSVVDRKNVAGVEVFRIKVERKHSKEFIDLFFSTHDPYYKNPDVWVDWTGDNGPGGKTSSLDKKDARIFPIGQPENQGDKIRVPDSGEEQHWIIGRLRNIGNVRAEQVRINFSVCDPPGAGDRGNFNVRDTIVLPTVDPTGLNKPIHVIGSWKVPAGMKGHTCVMVEVADLKIPQDHTGAALASDDVRQANNRAQKNVDDIGPSANSPFDPVEFEFSVNNSGQMPEVAYLEPEGLPYGMMLTVTPKRRTIRAGETAIFRCVLELDDKVIDASCRGDHDFRINAWRVDEDSAILWGGVEYRVRPRKRSTADLTGWWDHKDEVEISGTVSPSNITGRVRIRLAYANHYARWVTVDLQPGATFKYKEKAPPNTRELFAVALFEGNKYYSESRSPERKITPPPALR